MRLLNLCLSLALVAATAALAEVDEIFSPYVHVFAAEGQFPQRLIRLSPPPKKDWRTVDDQRHGFKLSIPEGLEVDTQEEGSRTLRLYLDGASRKFRPALRIDVFKPGKNDPTDVGVEYAKKYAEDYPAAAFNNKFVVLDSGLVQLKKGARLALVGGTYPQGAVRAYRIQCQHLSPDQQLILTFDGAEEDWPKYQDTVGRILLSLEVPKEKGKK